MLTTGAVTSPETIAFIPTLLVAVAVLPAASFAVAVIVCVPLATPDVFQLNVKGAAVLLPKEVPSTLTLTLLTPTLSVALTAMDTVPETVTPVKGDVILTTGGVLSLPPKVFTGVVLNWPDSNACLLAVKKLAEISKGTFASKVPSSVIAPPSLKPEAEITCVERETSVFLQETQRTEVVQHITIPKSNLFNFMVDHLMDN